MNILVTGATGYIGGLRSEVIVHDPGAQALFKINLISYTDAVRHALEGRRVESTAIPAAV